MKITVIRKQRPSFYNKDWQILEISQPEGYVRETGNYRFRGMQTEELWINNKTQEQHVVVRRHFEHRQEWK